MKTRESGMPDEPVWEGFFDPAAALRLLGLGPASGDVVDFGCGYGTFALPAAAAVATSGVVHALDIESEMVTRTAERARTLGLTNLRAAHRDFAADGTGLAESSVGFAMLFNILHCERPLDLLAEAHRVLRPGGVLAVTHWRHDPATPRGPSLGIRPTPERCRAWAIEAGFEPLTDGSVELPPYHYGLSFRKPTCSVEPGVPLVRRVDASSR